MDEAPIKMDAIPPQMAKHKWGILLWLLPVMAISLVPVVVVLFAGINALRSGEVMPGEAWQIAGVALGIISGLLIGVGASAAYQVVQR